MAENILNVKDMQDIEKRTKLLQEAMDNDQLVKPEYLDILGAFVLPSSGEGYTYSGNGYVTIPEDMPKNYLNKVYYDLDDAPVGGLTFSGYVTELNGELALLRLEQGTRSIHAEKNKAIMELMEPIHKKVRPYCIPVLGFDDQHAQPNQLNGMEGATYLRDQLKDIQVNNIGVHSKYISTLSIQEEDPDYTWLKETVASYKAIKGDK